MIRGTLGIACVELRWSRSPDGVVEPLSIVRLFSSKCSRVSRAPPARDARQNPLRARGNRPHNATRAILSDAGCRPHGPSGAVQPCQLPRHGAGCPVDQRRDGSAREKPRLAGDEIRRPGPDGRPRSARPEPAERLYNKFPLPPAWLLTARPPGCEAKLDIAGLEQPGGSEPLLADLRAGRGVARSLHGSGSPSCVGVSVCPLSPGCRRSLSRPGRVPRRTNWRTPSAEAEQETAPLLE